MQKNRDALTQARLKELLSYDPESGIFKWIRTGRGPVKYGSVAGRLSSGGYIQIMVDGFRYMAHRLAWLYVNGRFPPDSIDHINRLRTDNRIANLRLATSHENLQNYSKPITNKSGVIGVSWHKATQKWTAQIGVNQKRIYLGVYDTIEEAAAARAAAKEKYHTFHPVDEER